MSDVDAISRFYLFLMFINNQLINSLALMEVEILFYFCGIGGMYLATKIKKIATTAGNAIIDNAQAFCF
jgi:hypothetical protein